MALTMKLVLTKVMNGCAELLWQRVAYAGTIDFIWVDVSHLEENSSQNKSNSDVHSVALRKEAWE